MVKSERYMENILELFQYSTKGSNSWFLKSWTVVAPLPFKGKKIPNVKKTAWKKLQ